jgi:hypothetical protein
MALQTRISSKRGARATNTPPTGCAVPLLGLDGNQHSRHALQPVVSLRSAIEQAAYYRAEKRGFEPGHELDDWLCAEAAVIGDSGPPLLPIMLSNTLTTQADKP